MFRLFSTDDAIHGLVLRVVAGAVMFPHGAQKLLGWFGGHGFEGTLGFLTGSIGLPTPVAVTVILAESVGALMLIAGAATRIWAVLLAATMIGAVATLHASHGFFMNWTGAQGGEGFEYHLLYLGMTGLLAVYGAGRWSVDGWIADRLAARQPTGQPALT